MNRFDLIYFWKLSLEFQAANSIFPDSTRCGDAEAGNNNQVQVALVLICFSQGKMIGGKTAVVGLGVCE